MPSSTKLTASQTHLKSIGLRQSEVSITLLFGPLSGAFLQPYFGTWSDQCRSRWGRRKPFIIIGTLALVISILSLAWAESITQFLLSPYAPPQASYRAVLVAVTMLSAFCMWVAIQPVQIGLRTLITDACSDRDQTKANAWATTYNNIAATLANLAAWNNMLPHAATAPDRTVFKDLSVLAVIVLIVTVAISCLAVEEKRFDRAVDILESRNHQPSKGAIDQTDSRIGSFVLLAFSAMSLFAAILLPTLVSASSSFTLRRIWVATQALFASSMLATLIFTSTIGTILLFSLVGVSWAASNWIPFALLGTELSSSSSRRQLSDDGSDDEAKYHKPTDIHSDPENILTHPGLVYGLHNLFICLPQILVTLGMGIVSVLSDSGGGEDTLKLAWILRLGGIFALVSMYLATKLDDV
ncbi:MAG: hypothetical protein LQ346_008903 [Caloplaca aetnensis]|nr:MAG: hypothetical protein LQ346_008903 [Caloplaca aetnensis]